MSSEARRVKLLVLINLVLGVVLAVAGFVLAQYVLVAEGVLTCGLGARGALIANVPARIAQLVKLSAVALLVQLACVAGVVFMVGPENVANDPVPVCLGAVPAVISLVVLLLARGMTKRAERLR